MRFTITFFTAVTAFTAAASAGALLRRQDVTYPACADTCLQTANPAPCASDDVPCQCKNQAFINATATCVNQACTGSDLTQADEAAVQVCLAVGVNIASTSSSSSGTSSSSSSSSSSATTSSSSSAAPATTSNTSGATANSVNAIAGIAAVGLAALVF